MGIYFGLVRHGRISSETTISRMQVLCTYQVKETNHHEHDSLPICIHLGDVRLDFVKLQQSRETYYVKAETFANVIVHPHV